MRPGGFIGEKQSMQMTPAHWLSSWLWIPVSGLPSSGNATFAAHTQSVIHYELPVFALVLACSPSGICAAAHIA